MIDNALLIPVVIAIFTILPLLFLFSGQYGGAVLMGFVPIGLMALSNRRILSMAFIALYFSGLQYAGIPMRLEMYQIMMLLFCLNALLSMMAGRGGISLSRIYIGLLFSLWIVVVILVRGHALNISGGRMAGGAAYVHILLAFGVYVFCEDVDLSVRQWRWAIMLMIGFIGLQVFLHASVILSEGRFWYPMVILKSDFRFQQNLSAYMRSPDQTRWAILGHLIYLNLIPVIYWRIDRLRTFFYYAFFFLVSFAMAFVSGFRSRVLYVAVYAITYAVMRARRPLAVALLILAIISISIGSMALVSKYLPYGVQRTISFIPWANVSPEARSSADLTIDWRKALWTLAIENIHKYLVVGRGFGYDLEEYQFAVRGARMGSVWRDVYPSYVGAHMHQGILDLVFFLGIPGMLLFMAWLALECRRHIRRQQGTWQNQGYQRFHLTITIFFITNIIGFVVFGNPIQSELPNLIFQMALLGAISASDRRLSATAEEQISG